MSKLVRKNIRMSSELAVWYENKALSLGVSQSNLMAMALADYIKQEETIAIMSNLQNIIDQTKDLGLSQKSQKGTK